MHHLKAQESVEKMHKTSGAGKNKKIGKTPLVRGWERKGTAMHPNFAEETEEV